MRYRGREIFGQEENETTEFKSEFKKNDVAKDVCTFANGFIVAHLYYGIECEPGSDIKNIPGKAKGRCEIGIPYDDMNQTIESRINGKLSPSPNWNLEMDDEEGFVVLTIYPTSDICQLFEKNDYRTYIRKGHKTYPASRAEERLIEGRKKILRMLDVLYSFVQMAETNQLTFQIIFTRETDIKEGVNATMDIFHEDANIVLQRWSIIQQDNQGIPSHAHFRPLNIRDKHGKDVKKLFTLTCNLIGIDPDGFKPSNFDMS